MIQLQDNNDVQFCNITKTSQAQPRRCLPRPTHKKHKTNPITHITNKQTNKQKNVGLTPKKKKKQLKGQT